MREDQVHSFVTHSLLLQMLYQANIMMGRQLKASGVKGIEVHSNMISRSFNSLETKEKMKHIVVSEQDLSEEGREGT